MSDEQVEAFEAVDVDVRYRAQERAWVGRLLARLTSEERVEYEKRMRAAPSHYRSGKKYDPQRARIAAEVMRDFRAGPDTGSEQK